MFWHKLVQPNPVGIYFFFWWGGGGATVFTASFLVYYGTLKQNSTDIIAKRENYFITKCNKNKCKMHQVFISKCDSYYKLH